MTPRVRVVVVNYDGGDLTLECLRRLLDTDWPADRLEVVCVDNASSDDSVVRIRAELPEIRVVERAANDGYGAACNAALHDLDGIDHVAFVNNDVFVPPGWLAPLVDTLAADPRVGAACPKILLRDRYRAITIESPTYTSLLDPRPRGVRLCGVQTEQRDRWARSRCKEGFWGPEFWAGEPVSQWTGDGPRATLLVPYEEGLTELLLAAERAVRVTLATDESVNSVVPLPRPTWHRAPWGGAPFDVIHNVGVELVEDGYGADRGYLEVDRGQYDEPVDVFGWCGGAVLCSVEYLRDVGPFDERLFLYYEDVDLSWRGRRRGWRYRTAPESVVRHLHSAATSAHALRTLELNERNHLLVLARHGRPADTARALWHHVRATGSYARRDLASPLLRGESPRPQTVATRLRAVRDFARLAPRFVRT